MRKFYPEIYMTSNYNIQYKCHSVPIAHLICLFTLLILHALPIRVNVVNEASQRGRQTVCL